MSVAVLVKKEVHESELLFYVGIEKHEIGQFKKTDQCDC